MKSISGGRSLDERYNYKYRYIFCTLHFYEGCMKDKKRRTRELQERKGFNAYFVYGCEIPPLLRSYVVHDARANPRIGVVMLEEVTQGTPARKTRNGGVRAAKDDLMVPVKEI